MMNPNGPWITLFNRESQKATISRFQVGLVETKFSSGRLCVPSRLPYRCPKHDYAGVVLQVPCCARKLQSECPKGFHQSRRTNPHFSHPVKNAHAVPTFVGVSREGFRPCKLLPRQLATGEHFTSS
jgi:hypothetical protein